MSPESDDLEFDDQRVRPPGKILPFPAPRSVPDWLTGPDDGLSTAADPAEETTDEARPETLPQPVLRRPGVPDPVPLPVPVANVPLGEAKVEAGEANDAAAPAPPVRPRRGAPPGVWAPAASSVPILRMTPPVEPEPDDEDPFVPPAVRSRALPGHDEDLPPVAATPPPLASLREPWWMIALDSLRTSRPVQLGAAAALLAVLLLAWWSWPRGVGTTPLSELRRNPSQYDGRSVVVRGRVGDDVFAVGAGWAFYLMQGRDTIVIFTRTQKPQPRDVVTVKGQVSTGFLDGIPRQALFEDATPPQ